MHSASGKTPRRSLQGELSGVHRGYTTRRTKLKSSILRYGEDRRRHGYGRLLMATALQDAKETGILQGVLEVRISNAPAIHLYESFGFRQAGKRRGYYQDTGEDALIYTLDMGQTRTNP